MIYNYDALSFQIQNIMLIQHNHGSYDVEGRPYAALSFRRSGRAVFEIDGRCIVNEPGDMVYIPANVPYGVEYTAGESIVVHLTDCTYREAEKIVTDNKDLFEARFLHMRKVWIERHSVNSIKSHLYEIFAELEGESAISPVGAEFLRCIDYIEKNFDKSRLNVEALCGQFHMSRSSLQRRFLKYFGISAKEYVQKLRMNRALELLIEGKYSVKESASLCGFEDEKYFSRVFKKKFGYPPIVFSSGKK